MTSGNQVWWQGPRWCPPGLSLLMALVLAVFCGCHGEDDSGGQQVLKWTAQEIAGSLAYVTEHPRDRPFDGPYVKERWRQALAFLASDPALDRPYIVGAQLGGYMDAATDGEGFLVLQWIEHETHAVGFVLWDEESQGPIRVPAFAHEDPPSASGTRMRRSALRDRGVRIVLVDGNDVDVRPKAPLRSDHPPVVVFLPRSLIREGLRVGLYDNRENVSTNFVPLFIWPGTSGVIGK